MGQTGKVFIVDDDEHMREALSALVRRKGYEVLLFANGANALAAMSTPPVPRLILLDLAMPVLTGWEVLAHLVESPVLSKIPVLVLSASVDALPVGATRFLRKPFDANLVSEIIDELLMEERRARPRIPADVPCQVENSVQHVRSATIRNLSLGGALLEVTAPESLPTAITIRWRGNTGAEYRMSAEVRHQQSLDGVLRAGVRFLEGESLARVLLDGLPRAR